MKDSLEPTQKRIMIIDDEPNNLNILEAMLREEGGYEIVAFPNGASALAVAYNEPPDLILLDIRMPRMDGFEVCRRLKASKKLEGIPVLFLSALTDPHDKVKGFEFGALDYITKPLSEVEVLARVKTHLSLYAYQLDMEKQIHLRTEELVEAHRRLQIWDDAKNQWLRVLSHEMRTPLTGLFGIGDYVFDELPDGSPLKEFRSDYIEVRGRMLKLVDDAFLLTSIKVDSHYFKMSSVSLKTAINEAVSDVGGDYAKIEVLASEKLLENTRILANPSLLFRACSDLLRVATMCVKQGQKVFIDAVHEGQQVVVSLLTTGPELSPSCLESFFEVGGQRKMIAPGGDFGLRPALAARIIELFKGKAFIRNGKKGGVITEIRLPVVPEDQKSAQWAVLDKVV
jgi:two-component system sensor histidine kinase/response regulator